MEATWFMCYDQDPGHELLLLKYQLAVLFPALPLFFLLLGLVKRALE